MNWTLSDDPWLFFFRTINDFGEKVYIFECEYDKVSSVQCYSYQPFLLRLFHLYCVSRSRITECLSFCSLFCCCVWLDTELAACMTFWWLYTFKDWGYASVGFVGQSFVLKNLCTLKHGIKLNKYVHYKTILIKGTKYKIFTLPYAESHFIKGGGGGRGGADFIVFKLINHFCLLISFMLISFMFVPPLQVRGSPTAGWDFVCATVPLHLHGNDKYMHIHSVPHHSRSCMLTPEVALLVILIICTYFLSPAKALRWPCVVDGL